MFRALPLLVLVVCASFAHAQSVDLSRVHSITAPVRHAGTFDLRTGQFQHGAAPKSGCVVDITIYHNTCSWPGGSLYLGAAACEDVYDEGRVPTSGGASQRMTSWEIAYCTAAPTGSVDIDWEIFDAQPGLGSLGACTFGSAGVPPAFTAGLASFDSSSQGFPLPGSTSSGTGCWIVSLAAGSTAVPCITASSSTADLFVWRFRQNNNLATPSGPMIAGEPSIPGGAGTYNIPPGVDPIFGTPCGHGLGTQDLYWLNVDNTAVGGVPPAGCLNAAGGTGCYWFGGYPSNPFASYWLKVQSDGACGACNGNPVDDCTAKTNSLGCTPTVTWCGIPAQVGCATKSFTLTANNLVGNKNGLWFYGTNGLNGVAFQGGHLCIKPTIKRLHVVNSGGQGSACNGSISTDFNVRICSGSDAALVPGALVGTQCWSRDPASPSTTNLTSAISFVFCP